MQTQPLRHRLWIARTDSTRIQMLRNLVAGTAATSVDYVLLIVLTEAAGLHYVLSAGIAYAAATLVRYLLSIKWVFARRRIENRPMEIAVFAAIGIAGLGLNVVLVWLFTDGAGLHYVASKAITMVMLFFWNFFVRKLILFR